LATIFVAGMRQTNGFGTSFQCDAQTSMAPMRVSTLEKERWRKRKFVSCANQPSPGLSHDVLVGVKCRCQRLLLGYVSHSAIGGAECAERLSRTT
jgi:hypothetical protein